MQSAIRKMFCHDLVVKQRKAIKVTEKPTILITGLFLTGGLFDAMFFTCLHTGEHSVQTSPILSRNISLCQWQHFSLWLSVFISLSLQGQYRVNRLRNSSLFAVQIPKQNMRDGSQSSWRQRAPPPTIDCCLLWMCQQQNLLTICVLWYSEAL